MAISVGMRRFAVTAMVAVVSCVLGGCGMFGGGPKYDVMVSLDEAWTSGGRAPTLEVDLVGANPSQAGQLRSASVSQYFSAGDPFRAAQDKATLTFTSQDPSPKTLSKSDPIWAKWNAAGATDLFVLVNLPGIPDQPGDADPRRLILPLDPARWTGRELDIAIRRSGPVVLTPQKPVGQ